MDNTRSILVPLDGSPSSLEAVRHAVELAELTGSHITLLHVVHLTSAETMGMRMLDAKALTETLERMAAPTLAKADPIVGTSRVEEVVELGDPADEILGWAKRHGALQIVMGSRGLGPLRELLLGSVSEKVVRRAPCPVTVVR